MKKTAGSAAAAAASCTFCSQNRITSIRRLEDVAKERCSSANLDIGNALQLFEEMLDANPKPSICSFTILLTRILRMNNPSHYPTVLCLYSSMNWVGGISPTEVTYGVLVECCTRMNRVDLGFSIFGTMLKRCRTPDTAIFRTLVKGLCIEKKVADAAQLIDRMLQWGCSPDVVSCNFSLRVSAVLRKPPRLSSSFIK